MARLKDATVAVIAEEALAALASGRQIEPFSMRHEGFGLEDGYAAAAVIRRRREAHGERCVGRKIGFTNRNLWERYGVRSPIWGDMYDSTVRDIAADDATHEIGGLAEPLIEPEIVFGLARAPAPDMDEASLMASIGWVAVGFEIVHSIFPGWRFAAPDTVAGFGMHGALLVGPRHAVGPDAAGAWRGALETFDIVLACDGETRGTGAAADVLGGPLTALAHLVRGLAAMPGAQPLVAGDIVTTGSLTLAFPVVAGETWRATLNGPDIAPIEVRFT